MTGEKTGFVLGFIHGEDRIVRGGEFEIVREEPTGTYGMLVVVKEKNGYLGVIGGVTALWQADAVAKEEGKDIATITDARNNMSFLKQYSERFLIFIDDTPNLDRLKRPE